MNDQRSTSVPLDGLIRRLRLHSPLGDDDAIAIANLPVIVTHQARASYLVTQGERTLKCAVLVQGFAQRYRLTSNGQRQILAIYIPGDPIDFDHLFLAVADDAVQILDEAVVAWIHHADLRSLLAQRPAVAEAVTRSLLVDASIFREWTVNVGQRDARTRIAHLLCEMSARLRAQGFDLKNLPLPLTQDQIADATGLTSIHVNRTLKALAAEQCIERRGALVMLPNPDGLRQFADFDDQYLHVRS